MSTKIRLKKMGAKKRPFYRIIVTDSRNKRDGEAIEELGHYHPIMEKDQIKIDLERTQKWLDVGAIPSDTVKDLINKVKKASK